MNNGHTPKNWIKNQSRSILNTYAPHMGYQHEQIETYWVALNRHIGAIPKSFIRMWRADNNEQVAQISNNNNVNNIGKWAMANKADKGDGAHLTQTCINREYIFASANKSPKNDIKLNLATWQFSAETLSRKIDFFLMPYPRRNWEKQSKIIKLQIQGFYRYIQVSLNTNNNTIPT